jgi:hypothetical protein
MACTGTGCPPRTRRSGDLLNDLPDEVWVIQINPTGRDEEPDTTETIADRRNELAGNLSLYQELPFIERINGRDQRRSTPIQLDRSDLGTYLAQSGFPVSRLCAGNRFVAHDTIRFPTRCRLGSDAA